NLYHNKMTDSNYNIQPEQVNPPTLSQEFEEEKNTPPGVSRELTRAPLELQELRSSLTAVPDSQFSRADQLGPWYTGDFRFGSNNILSGNSNLVIQRNGWFTIRGNFHNSGAPSHGYTFVWAVSAGDTVYVFAHKGLLHGSFDTGSRNDNWFWSDIIPMNDRIWDKMQLGRNRWRAASDVTDINVSIDFIVSETAEMSFVKVVKIVI
ncbi:hypothetical protein CN353_23500, partial [Bacillus cereus]